MAKNFLWIEECQTAFDELKRYLGSPPLLSKSEIEKVLYLYLVVSPLAISPVLIQQEAKVQKPV